MGVGRKTVHASASYSAMKKCFLEQPEGGLKLLMTGPPTLKEIMSAMGQSRTFAVLPYYVRFYPDSGHRA